jgi:hypothetical protein
VGGFPDAGDQSLENRPGDVFERFVPQVGRTDLESREPKRIRVLIRQVHDETALHQDLKQVVGRRSG